ncbi:DUF3644 domain-containing protein [Rhodoglobus aureus]|uniref:DUF3644 domain-containing protein n=1 Tax=Rhodoglobus aureus TaxID=191497 RepID=A0ABN1VRL6_9MICO
MSPKPAWWHVLQGSKNEVRLAVDLYNRSGNERQLEAFIVHMSMGWLKLLQANALKNNGDPYIRGKGGRRVSHPDGDWTYKSLHTMAYEYFSANDARAANLTFFTGLRNRIEHRHEKNIASFVSGRTQSNLLNYESVLVEIFGEDEGLGSELRFPLFVSTITGDGIKAVKAVRAAVPKGLLEWIQDFDTGVDESVTRDQGFEFRVFLLPHTGPKSEADASMTFVRESELDDSERKVLDQVRTVIREKQVPVDSLGSMRAGQVVDAVRERVPNFTMHWHTRAWKFFNARPDTKNKNRTSTRSDFCRYSAPFEQYVYTQSWVDFLIRKFGDASLRDEILGRKPQSTEKI